MIKCKNMEKKKVYCVPDKYIFATKMKKQYLASFDGHSTKRKNGGKEFFSSDGTWVRPILADLKYRENGVKVDIYVSLHRRPHSHKMWLAGGYDHRVLVEHRPRYDGETLYARGGEVWCDIWCMKEFFPDLAPRTIYPVYVTCERKCDHESPTQ